MSRLAILAALVTLAGCHRAPDASAPDEDARLNAAANATEQP